MSDVVFTGIGLDLDQPCMIEQDLIPTQAAERTVTLPVKRAT